MDLLFAILFALKIYVDPTWSKYELQEKNPEAFERASKIIDGNMYHVDGQGVIIIDETGGNN